MPAKAAKTLDPNRLILLHHANPRPYLLTLITVLRIFLRQSRLYSFVSGRHLNHKDSKMLSYERTKDGSCTAYHSLSF